jgi:hypothetical protein
MDTGEYVYSGMKLIQTVPGLAKAIEPKTKGGPEDDSEGDSWSNDLKFCFCIPCVTQTFTLTTHRAKLIYKSDLCGNCMDGKREVWLKVLLVTALSDELLGRFVRLYWHSVYTL